MMHGAINIRLQRTVSQHLIYWILHKNKDRTETEIGAVEERHALLNANEKQTLF